ncbi:potassium-transporting ATPase subunit F [Massilia sp. TS11]|nr:potassium-transporting ATPase subunit F [Massilia sp. TS11]MCG2584358.1 potassium-transporting ATPase subunit F [Massilia sp. TS11]
MNLIYLASGIAASGLLLYLLYALIYAEEL